MLEFRVEKQKLTRLDVVEPATDSEQYLKAKFTVSDADWNGKAKTALFRLDEVVYKALLDNNNVCIVPSEVLVRDNGRYARTQGSKIFVSLIGEYSTTRITTNEVRVDLNTSGYTDAEEPAKPTESEYQQIITQYANNEAAINEAKAECEAARADLVGVKNIFANAIKGNLSGAVVSADDVSPVEHNPVVKVHGKNLFNYNAWKNIAVINGNAVFSDGGVVSLTATGNDCHTNYNSVPTNARIPVKEGEVYTLSWETDATEKGKGLVLILPEGKAADFKTADATAKQMTYTVPRGYKYIVFRLGVANAGDTIKYSNIQIEKGETATAFETYIDPSIVTVRRYKKNLCPPMAVGKTATISGMTFTGKEGGGIGVSGIPTTFARYSLYSGVAPTKSGYITMSLLGTFTNIIWDFQLKNADKNIIKQMQTGTVGTLNLDDYPDTVYWDIGIKRYEDGVATTGTVYVQVETGLEATEFEEYSTPTIHTPASDGTVERITSLSPNMTILTDTEGAIVECEYIKDTNVVIQKIADALNITI